MNENPLVLTITEAAEHVGVRPATIRSWVMRGYLEPLQRGVHPLKFHLLDLARCHADRQPRSWHEALDRAWNLALQQEQQAEKAPRTRRISAGS